MSDETIEDWTDEDSKRCALSMTHEQWRLCERHAALTKPALGCMDPAKARAILAFRDGVAAGLGKPVHAFLLEVVRFLDRSECSGLATGRQHRQSTAQALVRDGLLVGEIMERADEYGFLKPGRAPILAYSLTPFGRQIAHVLGYQP